jgi:two-component system response regulator DesR
MVAQMIRTFVAEPTTLTREGLVALLAREEDIEVIAAVERAEEVVPAACELKPDDHDGILIAETLCTMVPGCRCAILSHSRHPGHLERAIAAQVYGYLVHDCPAEFLCAAIRQMAAGNKVIDPELAFSMLGSRACPLTLREADALRAAAKGFTTEEIAEDLCLAAGTVRNYLSRAITKVGGRNRVDAIRIADKSGWL